MIGADIGRYALLYGTPEFRGLDDEQARPWPERSAIRTVGLLEEIPGRGRSGGGSDLQGGGDYDTVYARLRVCGERHCLALVPVPDMQDTFAGAVLAWVHQGVEVVGAIDQLPASYDCSWRLEVKGTVETVAGYVYLHAKGVALVRHEKDDSPAQ